MNCEKENQATFEFPSIGLEIKPFTVDYKQNVQEFDYAQATFSEGVGDYLTEHIKTEVADGRYDSLDESDFVLSNEHPVLFKQDGDVVDRLYFSPDFITVGDTTTIEFHDPVEFLQGGVVDIKRSDLQLKKIYEEVFSNRKESGNEIFTDIKFTLPDEIAEHLITSSGPAGDGIAGYRSDLAEAQDEDTRILESGENVDLYDVSPLQAIINLNKVYGLSAWSDDYGTLWIGSRESITNYHLASQNDERVWKITTPHISQPRKPVKQVTVKGAFIDSPAKPFQQAVTNVSQFLHTDEDQSQDDFRSLGIAKRTDITYGETHTFEAKDAKRESLPYIALKKFYEKRRESKNGSVTINGKESGTEVSTLNELKLGDIIELVPPETCGDTFNQDYFRINGITHRIDGMQWQIDLDIQVYVNEQVDKELRFLNPRSGEELTKEELFG